MQGIWLMLLKPRVRHYLAKFVLHGGFKNLCGHQLEAAWKDFFVAIEPSAGADVLILPWANSTRSLTQHHHQIPAAFSKRCRKYWHINTYNIKIINNSSVLEEYFQQKHKQKSTLIYLPGGILGDKAVAEMQKALPRMASYLAQPNITFAGVSAGAYALTAFYYHPRKQKILPGGGLVQGGVCCHADEERQQNLGTSHLGTSHLRTGNLSTSKFSTDNLSMGNPAIPELFYILPDGRFEVITAPEALAVT